MISSPTMFMTWSSFPMSTRTVCDMERRERSSSAAPSVGSEMSAGPTTAGATAFRSDVTFASGASAATAASFNSEP